MGYVAIQSEFRLSYIHTCIQSFRFFLSYDLHWGNYSNIYIYMVGRYFLFIINIVRSTREGRNVGRHVCLINFNNNNNNIIKYLCCIITPCPTISEMIDIII